MQNPPPGYTRVCPYLLYEDAASAVEYLTTTFGFVQRVEQTGAAGRMHRELVLGEDGLVMLGQAGDSFKSPARLDAYPSVLVHFYVDDVDALHERALAAGADVMGSTDTGAVVMTAGCRTPVVFRTLLRLGDSRGWSDFRTSPRRLRAVRRETSGLLVRILS